jgi:hypothetical protein
MESADSQPVLDGQLAAPGQQNLVNVPADLLTTLVTSVDDLRKELHQIRDDNSSLAKEVSELCNANASLTSEITCLKEHAGVGFGLFPKFPFEIRNMIGEFALKEPQIHVNKCTEYMNTLEMSLSRPPNHRPPTHSNAR